MICCKKSGGAQPTLAVEEPKIKVGAGVRTAPCTIWHPERSTKYPGRRSESLRCTILTRHSRLHNPLLRSLGSSQLKYESQPWENLESVWTGKNNTIVKKASFQWKRKGLVHFVKKLHWTKLTMALLLSYAPKCLAEILRCKTASIVSGWLKFELCLGGTCGTLRMDNRASSRGSLPAYSHNTRNTWSNKTYKFDWCIFYSWNVLPFAESLKLNVVVDIGSQN